MLIAVARHAETDSNRMKLWVSDQDYSINEKGKKQAEILAEVLRPYNFEFIVTSDKRRAIQTAEIISAILNIPIEKKDPIFRDRYYGEIEGMTSDEIQNKYGIRMTNSLNEEIDKLRNTEKVNDLRERVTRAKDLLIREYRDNKVILITHGAFARMFYRIYNGSDDGIYFYNCSNVIFECNADSCVKVRDLSHIDYYDGS